MTHDPSDLRFTGRQQRMAELILDASGAQMSLQPVEHHHAQAMRSVKRAKRQVTTPVPHIDWSVVCGWALLAVIAGASLGLFLMTVAGVLR